jgi:hypothetical protein
MAWDVVQIHETAAWWPEVMRPCLTFPKARREAGLADEMVVIEVRWSGEVQALQGVDRHRSPLMAHRQHEQRQPVSRVPP